MPVFFPCFFLSFFYENELIHINLLHGFCKTTMLQRSPKA
ncbi:hypothetical protein Zm00014a_044399 [Zea mays]|uniref:Uncharacterized protein n=1 Tax=Zea mays TaxID=4577 RepID=A0A3L6G167_MAIZE|nr:hypothetical protein Zm00014a_044399 [Zea mays]